MIFKNMGLTRKVIFFCVLLLFEMLVFAYVLKEKKLWKMLDFLKKHKKQKKQKKIDRVLFCPKAEKGVFAKHFWAFLVSMSTDIVCIYGGEA